MCTSPPCLATPRSNLRHQLKAISYAGFDLRMIALNKLIIFSAVFILSMPSPSLAGVILVDEESARQKELQERQRNERSNSNTSDGNASRSSQSNTSDGNTSRPSQPNTSKDEKGLKKKNTETNLIFGF